MPEMQEDTPNDRAGPALDEFVESAAKLTDGLSDVMACALRMQLLILEDARNMMAKFGAEIDATGGRGDNGSDVWTAMYLLGEVWNPALQRAAAPRDIDSKVLVSNQRKGDS